MDQDQYTLETTLRLYDDETGEVVFDIGPDRDGLGLVLITQSGASITLTAAQAIRLHQAIAEYLHMAQNESSE